MSINHQLQLPDGCRLLSSMQYSLTMYTVAV